MDNIIAAIIGATATILAALITQGIRISLWRRKITWDDALRVAKSLLTQIQNSGWKPEIIIGLGRSGGIWGGWFAGNLGSLPFWVIDDKYTVDNSVKVDFPLGREILNALRQNYPYIQKVLVVEGASSTGQTPAEFVVKFSKELEGLDVRFAVLYKNPVSVAGIDFVGDSTLEPWPSKFPWHYTDLYRPYLRDLFSLK